MHKYQLKKKYQDGSVAPQDFEAKKAFNGSAIHEYAEPTTFIESMIEGGYIEEVTEEVLEEVAIPKRRGRPSGKSTTD